ncbi:MAG: hypothetical protein HYU54_04740 [Actinobacteria bacterium]|nr:hypothetical protein [Actinomycetota bacterium]
MRRWTLITLIGLFALLLAAATWQIVIASRDQPPYRGPVPGTPFPVSVTPTA